ncbi:MAG: acyl-CoA dehydrogenase family protein [Thaumarchaeota archaeon]|nr:acyl-CoA dehydrogenase family protein [Nitrososphaerota archaeon]
MHSDSNKPDSVCLHKYGDDEQKILVPALLGETGVVRYGATWFTELQGGSNLGTNLVEALHEGGVWRVNGDTKYFASNAGLADYALVIAHRDYSNDLPLENMGIPARPFLTIETKEEVSRRNFIRADSDKGLSAADEPS